MAFLSSAKSIFLKTVCTEPVLIGCESQQVRTMYTKWKNLRDMKRRKLVKEYAPERLRLVSMKRNDILPIEIQNLASEGFDNIPRQSSVRQLTPRCVVTGRAYGTVQRWRISRFIFRHLVDYNKMAGVQRAIW